MTNSQYISISNSCVKELYTQTKQNATSRFGIVFRNDFTTFNVVDFEKDVEVLNCVHYVTQNRIKLNQKYFTQKIWFCINKNTQKCDQFYFFNDERQDRVSRSEQTSNSRLMTLNNVASFCLDKTLTSCCDVLIKLATYNNRFNLDKWQACNRENDEKAKAIALLEKLGAAVPEQLLEKATLNTDFLDTADLQELARITAKIQDKLTQIMLQDYTQKQALEEVHA